MHVFATSPSAPDREFATLPALARHILDLRARLAGTAELALIPGMLGRAALPEGCCVVVRALDGSHGGKGLALGYALMAPERGLGAPNMAKALMSALVAVKAFAAQAQLSEAAA